MAGVAFDARDGQGGVLGREPDGGVAAQGADFEGVPDTQHTALQGEGFAVGGGAADVGEAVGVAGAQGAG